MRRASEEERRIGDGEKKEYRGALERRRRSLEEEEVKKYLLERTELL